MNIQPIKNESDYKTTLARVDGLMTARIGSPEGDELDVLTTLIQAYEAKHHALDPPDAVEAIKFRMEQSSLTVADLMPAIGARNRVYEVLNKKRSLTLPMIRKLNRMFGIPAESLLKEA